MYFVVIFYLYICNMLSRISILSFIAAFVTLLCGGYWVDSVATESRETTQECIEAATIDADNLDVTSLLSGRTSLRTPVNSRRSIHRSNSKRSENTQIVTQSKARGVTIAENSNYAIKSNLLGGVVARRAFYSLCCLRI